MIEFLNNAIQRSLTDHLPVWVYSIDGMTSNKVKNLLNNLSRQDCNYLEIGVWRGATFVSSLFSDNFKRAYAIDNWSQFGNVRDEFYRNIAALPKDKIKVIEQDCFKVDLNEIDSIIDTYFYDGNHSAHDQENALKYYYPVLADQFIFIVDDFNDAGTYGGTFKAISDLGLKIKYMSYLPSRFNCDTQNYWNGIAVFYLEK